MNALGGTDLWNGALQAVAATTGWIPSGNRANSPPGVPDHRAGPMLNHPFPISYSIPFASIAAGPVVRVAKWFRQCPPPAGYPPRAAVQGGRLCRQVDAEYPSLPIRWPSISMRHHIDEQEDQG